MFNISSWLSIHVAIKHHCKVGLKLTCDVVINQGLNLPTQASQLVPTNVHFSQYNSLKNCCIWILLVCFSSQLLTGLILSYCHYTCFFPSAELPVKPLKIFEFKNPLLHSVLAPGHCICPNMLGPNIGPLSIVQIHV